MKLDIKKLHRRQHTLSLWSIFNLSLSSILLSTINNFLWKSFLDFLTPFVTISFISFQFIITAWASEIWLGHQHLFLPSPQGSPASTSEIQYSVTVLILLALCAVFGALIFRSYDTVTSWIFNTSVTISVSFINLFTFFIHSQYSLLSFTHLSNPVISMQRTPKSVFLGLAFPQFPFPNYHGLFPLTRTSPINTCPWMATIFDSLINLVSHTCWNSHPWLNLEFFITSYNLYIIAL